MFVLILVLTLILIILIILLLRFRNKKQIPTIIWTYWNGDMPLVVHLCIDSWRKYNPGFEIIVLNEHNLARYADFDFSTIKHANESQQRLSDFVRLHVLSKYGGIWMDASIICQAPITPLLSSSYDMIGFYLDGFTTLPRSKVIESWFFACPKNSSFVKAWNTEFQRTNDYDTIDDYINDVHKNTDFQKIDTPNYLCIHISAQKVLQEKYHSPYNLFLFKAEDMPFKYLFDAAWDPHLAVQSLQYPSPYHSIPLLKMRGLERNEMIAYPDHTLFFPHKIQTQTHTVIPSVIWTYWEGDIPMLTHLCIDSWRKYNPTYEIIIVTKSTLSKYVSIDIDQLRHANESPARFSDFVRLNVLAQHGGIWLDATIICHQSFDWLHDLQNKHKFQFLAYKMENHTQPKWRGVCDVIESSAFACTPLCPIVVAWRDEFMKLNEFENADDYVQSVRDREIDLQDSPGNYGYWAIYTSYLAVIQTNSEFNTMMYLLEGTETLYRWQFYPKVENHEAQVRQLLEDRYLSQPLIKLSNWDREQLNFQEPDVSKLFDP